jgi:hypothetical protein
LVRRKGHLLDDLVRALLQAGVDNLLEGDVLALSIGDVGSEDGPRAGADNAVGKRGGAESGEDGDVNGADRRPRA